MSLSDPHPANFNAIRNHERFLKIDVEKHNSPGSREAPRAERIDFPQNVRFQLET
jgi:hypothetical protein